VTSLPDAERDASDVMQALAGLAAMLRRSALDLPGGLDPDDPYDDETGRMLLGVAEDAGVAAARVVAYLRDRRGNGDGELAAVPPRLGQWREWVPPRGHVFGLSAGAPRATNEVPQPRRSDPGE
jgi:hypothetical protein